MRHVLFPTTFQGFPGKHNHVGYPLASSPHLLTPPGCPLLLRGLEGKVSPSPKVYMLHQAESGRLGDQGATFLNLDFLCACTKHVTFLLPACSFRGWGWGAPGLRKTHLSRERRFLSLFAERLPTASTLSVPARNLQESPAFHRHIPENTFCPAPGGCGGRGSHWHPALREWTV